MSRPNKRSPEELYESEAQVKRQNKLKTHERETTTVIVKNLPNNYNFHKVKRYFKNCGNINHVDVINAEENRSKIARVEFDSYDSCLSALTKNYKIIGDREIIVEPLIGCTVWITNFPPGYDSTKLRSLIAEQVGLPILSLRLPSLAFNSKRRFVYIDFTSPTAALRAVSILNDTLVQGFKIVAKISNPAERARRSDEAVMEGRELIVKNLDLSTVTEESLADLFTKFGELERITIPSGKFSVSETKPNEGYAFVSFKTLESAKAALSLNKTSFQNNIILVSRANKKSYLERQEVKRILASRRNNEHVASLFPLSSSTSTEEVRELILLESTLKNINVVKILLVTDHEGALIVCDNSVSAAILILALNGKRLNNVQLRCGSVHDLLEYESIHESRRRKLETNDSLKKEESLKSLGHKAENKKFSNNDFREMFLTK